MEGSARCTPTNRLEGTPRHDKRRDPVFDEETVRYRKRRKLSDEGYAEAIAYGQRKLEENKARRDRMNLPDDMIYVGDRIISVLYMEYGEIYAVEVTAPER